MSTDVLQYMSKTFLSISMLCYSVTLLDNIFEGKISIHLFPARSIFDSF